MLSAVRSHFRSNLVGYLAALALVAAEEPAKAVTITEFPIAPGGTPAERTPRYIDVGPDGNLWFTMEGTQAGIGRMDTAGQPAGTIPDTHRPVDLVTAPDGTVYWTADGGLGRRQASGTVDLRGREPSYAIALTAGGELRWGDTFGASPAIAEICNFAGAWGSATFNCGGPYGATRITGLTLAADGRLWAAGYEANMVWKLNATDRSPETPIDLPASSGPARLALGPDGNLWVTMYDASAIDRITPAGVRTRFPVTTGAGPNDITVGPDGALWFTELTGNGIGRMTTDGTLTNEFAIPSANTRPLGIAAGPDGSLWFTESTRGSIGRVQLDPAPGSGAVIDRLAPSFVGRTAFSPRRFRVGSARTPLTLTRVAPKGSTLRYSLSEAATVKIAIERKTRGRRVGKGCRAPSRRNRRGRPCARYKRVGVLSRKGLQGANSVPFSGRLGRKALKPGSYRASTTATDAAGNVSTASRASFTIVR